MQNIIDIKQNIYSEDVFSLISGCHYNPTKEKIDRIVDNINTDKNVYAFGLFENTLLCGIIILKKLVDDSCEITEISTLKEYRGKHIGSRLIDYSLIKLKCKSIKAETDNDAVGFYKNYGFSITSLENKYHNRYLCKLKVK